MNRSERRIIEQVRNCYPRKRQYTLREAIHTLAQQGIIAYEAAQATQAPNIVNVWWTTPLTGEVDVKTEHLKDQEILTLRAELNRVHDEYTWLASRKQKPMEKRTMAKFTISVDEITDDALVVRGVQLTVDGVEEATVERIARKFVDSLGPYNATGAEVTGASPMHEHVCKCEASNGDKRPGTVDRRETGERSNA